MAEDNGTPLVNELESGPWPSFVKQIKEMAATNKLSAGLIKQLERSYEDSCSHWKHGGIVGVMGYGGGVIGRYSDLAEEIPDVAAFHTYRVNQPAGWFYSTKALRGVCDIWEKRGSGLTNIHGSTGDLVLLGGKTEEIENCFADLTKIKFDLGGSGSDVRTPSCCVGQARCEWACYDTMAFTQDITMTYQDELHRPAFPYKWKFKAAGCPNDCVASIARSDLSIIGTWKDDIQIDQDAVAEYLSQGEVDVQKNVINRCPTKCMSLDGKKLKINNSYCNRCMHCINKMPKALRPGKERGATILIGGKAPIIEGARLASVIIPFSPMEPPYQDIKDLCEKIWDLWGEHGKNRERIGEFMTRWGVGRFLEAIGVTPDPRMIKHPRDNPYIFYEEYYEEEETEEEA